MTHKDCYSILNNLAKNRVLSSIQIASDMIDCAIELFEYRELINLIDNIIKGQPSMAAVINIGFDIIKYAKRRDKNGLLGMKSRILDSSECASNKAGRFLKGIKNVATISYSQNVFDALIKINPDKVYLSVAHPACEGEQNALKLMENGIKPVLFEDSAYSLIIKDIDAIIVGADAIFDESFVNKTGTLYLALLSREFNVPFYVVSCGCKYLDKSKRVFFKIQNKPEDEISNVKCERINAYFEEIPIKFVNKMFVR